MLKHCSAGQDALCGSTLMIGIDELIEDGLLDKADKPKKIPAAAADFVAVCSFIHCCNLQCAASFYLQWLATAAKGRSTAALHMLCGNSLQQSRN